MTRPPAIFDVMAALPLAVEAAEAEAIARERWGIAATAEPLPGERDRNFHLKASDGRQYVLKFANPAEDAGFRAMQIAALRHIAATDPNLAVPRLVPLRDGTIETPVLQAGVPHATGLIQYARLLTWVDGTQIAHATPSPAQRAAYGATVARLQNALATFDHPARGNEMAWDLQHAPKLRDIAFTLPLQAARDVLLDLLDHHDRHVVPEFATLPRQIVHNDLNRMNVLVNPADHSSIAGIIDFGDIAHTATIFDLAIAAVQLPGGDAPLRECLAQFLRGYQTLRPLLPIEVALFPQLMATRYALGLTLASWHRHTQPDNPHFDLSEPAIRRRLATIAEFRTPGLSAFLARACGLEEGIK